MSTPTVTDRLRATWALGDYPAVADRVIPDLGAILVRSCEVGAGDRVLDVAAGAGNAALPAAAAGAVVVATDLVPELLDAGRTRAGGQGLELTWQEADAEALPFGDGAFDVVLSCVGVMFAAHHEQAAAELLRTCRPGGTIGLLSWTPEGFVGQLLATVRPYLPPPPPGAQPPPLWGREAHVRTLLGDHVQDVRASRATVRVDGFGSPAEFREFFATRYGPTVAAFRLLADEPDRSAALAHDIEELAAGHDRGRGGGLTMDWEYLLLTARRVPAGLS